MVSLWGTHPSQSPTTTKAIVAHNRNQHGQYSPNKTSPQSPNQRIITSQNSAGFSFLVKNNNGLAGPELGHYLGNLRLYRDLNFAIVRAMPGYKFFNDTMQSLWAQLVIRNFNSFQFSGFQSFSVAIFLWVGVFLT